MKVEDVVLIVAIEAGILVSLGSLFAVIVLAVK